MKFSFRIYIALPFLSLSVLTSCKLKDATLQGSSSGSTSNRKFEWCKPSDSSLEIMFNAIREFEASGKTSLTHALDGRKVSAARPPREALGLLETPPAKEPPPCGYEFDQSMTVTGQYIAGLVKGDNPAIALNAVGGACEIQTSSGILSVTRMESGGYMIELMGCGGRTRSEMMMPRSDLIKFAKAILRGV